jgi:phosphatidylserine/phosphatidylglycerophosphate/cardiolipin synthase-like enzyme
MKYMNIFFGWCCVAVHTASGGSFFRQELRTAWVEHHEVVGLRAPETFGKSHFIMGYEPSREPAQAPKKAAKKVSKSKTNAPCQAYFSPDDDICAQLISLIEHERKGIKAAVFVFTEPRIAQALLEAHKRGIAVEVITDPGCLKEKSNQIALLCNNGLCVRVYNAGTNTVKQASLMHHKFIIFDDNKDGASLLWTGSFNFTKSASRANQENVLVIADKQSIDAFRQQFERLKERSYFYGRAPGL